MGLGKTTVEAAKRRCPAEPSLFGTKSKGPEVINSGDGACGVETESARGGNGSARGVGRMGTEPRNDFIRACGQECLDPFLPVIIQSLDCKIQD